MVVGGTGLSWVRICGLPWIVNGGGRFVSVRRIKKVGKKKGGMERREKIIIF